MRLVNSGVEKYRSWMGQKFECTRTGNEYQIDASDISDAVSQSNSPARDIGIRCPDCGARITFEHDQREGHYVSHRSN